MPQPYRLPRSPRRARPYRPLVEPLEGRALPSVCTVDRFTDTGAGDGPEGDLRYCITRSGDGDVIRFAVAGTINLAGALPSLSRNVQIEGPGADRLAVRRDTGGDYRIFTVAAGAEVGISGLSITNGRTSVFGSGGCDGGGVLNDRGTLTLSDVVVVDNIAQPCGDIAFGGGIMNRGTLTLYQSTLVRNTAVGFLGGGWGGGAVNEGQMWVVDSTVADNRADNSGGIANLGTLTLVQSTVSGNEANCCGGGVRNLGTLVATHSTIANNTVSFGGGGGLFLQTGTAYLWNTIVAGNTAASGPDVMGALVSVGNNLIGRAAGGSGYDATDLLDVDPLLGPLADNGGPTRTHALLPGSPALDAGNAADAPAADQRGRPRVVADAIDIGAFEVQPGPLASFFLYVDVVEGTVGQPVDLYVFALDAYGHLVTDYTGAVAFASLADPGATLPAPVRLTPAGYVYLPGGATFATPGVHDLWAYDTVGYQFGYTAVTVTL